MKSAQEKALAQNEKDFVQELKDEMKMRSQLKLKAINEKRKSARVNSAARYKWLGKALKANNQSPDLFEKAHARDFQHAMKNAEEMHAIANRHVEEYLKKRKDTINWYKSNIERFQYNLGNPVTTICNWKADNTPSANQTIQTSGDFSQSPSPSGQPVSAGNNRVTMNIHSVTQNQNLQSNFSETFTTHRFVSVAPNAGLVNLTAYLEPVGSFSLSCGGDCFTPGFATFGIAARAKVHVITRDGRIFRTNNPDFRNIFADVLRADCDSDSRSSSFNFSTDTEELVRNRIILCATGDFIVVRVQYWVLTWNSHRSVLDLNLSSQGFGLNVPLVMIQIES